MSQILFLLVFTHSSKPNAKNGGGLLTFLTEHDRSHGDYITDHSLHDRLHDYPLHDYIHDHPSHTHLYDHPSHNHNHQSDHLHDPKFGHLHDHPHDYPYDHLHGHNLHDHPHDYPYDHLHGHNLHDHIHDPIHSLLHDHLHGHLHDHEFLGNEHEHRGKYVKFGDGNMTEHRGVEENVLTGEINNGYNHRYTSTFLGDNHLLPSVTGRGFPGGVYYRGNPHDDFSYGHLHSRLGGPLAHKPYNDNPLNHSHPFEANMNPYHNPPFSNEYYKGHTDNIGFFPFFDKVKTFFNPFRNGGFNFF